MFLSLASLMFVLGPELLHRCSSSTQEAARFPISPTSLKEFSTCVGEVATLVPPTCSFSGSVPFLLCLLCFSSSLLFGGQGSSLLYQLRP